MTGIFEVIGFILPFVIVFGGLAIYRRRDKKRRAMGIVKTRPNTTKIIALIVLAAVFVADFVMSVILVAMDVFPPVTVFVRIPLEGLILVYLCRAIIKERRVGYRRARAHN